MSEDSVAVAVLRLARERQLISGFIESSLSETGPTPEADPHGGLSPSQLLSALLAARKLTLDDVTALREEVTAALVTLDGASTPASDREANKSLPLLPFSNERYKLERLLGHGGMGQVYRAHDAKLQRSVALKFLHARDDNTTQKLFREARAQARIVHPGVCQVYDVGQHAGQLYIAMEYISGEPLRQATSKFLLEQKVLLIKQVAEALQAAHRIGIIHRDIKSTNILVTKNDGDEWRAVLLDFGLARDLDSSEYVTKSDVVMGTPAYMSPEQARGNQSRIDRRTDIYSVGAVLYEALTGRPPFQGGTESLLWQTLHEDPIPPRQHDPSIPIDLETIAIKCLQKEPNHRYDSAQALADDLERYLSGLPILGRKTSLSYRAQRFVLRHWVLVSFGLLLLLSVSALIGMSARGQRQADRRARLAQQLGREVELSDMFLRMVYSLPLHDVGAEESLIRERVARMQSQLLTMPPLEASLSHYAVGRSLLLLREYDQAISHLRTALSQGLQDPEVHQTLGRALGERYRLALRQIDGGSQNSWLTKRKQQLSEQYLVPALKHLEHDSLEQSGEVLINRALLALYREEYDKAQLAITSVLKVENWRSEAMKVSGDIHAARSSFLLLRGQHAEARQAMNQAIAQYQISLEMSRSDPNYHLAMATAYLQLILIDRYQGLSPALNHEKCIAHSKDILKILPGSLDARLIRIQAGIVIMRYLTDRGQRDSEIENSMRADLSYIVERDRGYPMISHVQSLSYMMMTESRIRRMEPLGDLPTLAERSAAEAAELHENPARSYQTLGDLNALLSYRAFMMGDNPIDYLKKSINYYKLGIKSSADNISLYEGIMRVYRPFLSISDKRGDDIESSFNDAVIAANGAIEFDSHFETIHCALGGFYLDMAELAWFLDKDPNDLISKSKDQTEESIRLNPDSAGGFLALASLYRLQALVMMKQGQDPSVLLTQARTAFERSQKLNPNDFDLALVHAKLLLAQAQHELSQRRSPETLLNEIPLALNPIRPLKARAPDIALIASRSALLRSQFYQGLKRTELQEESLRHVQRALYVHPKWPQALKLQAEIRLTLTNR